MKRTLSQTLPLLLFGLVLSGCARSCEEFERDMQTGSRHYHITQYSGGDEVARYSFRGILNNASGSDGYYWSVGDTPFEVSGDLKIQSWK